MSFREPYSRSLGTDLGVRVGHVFPRLALLVATAALALLGCSEGGTDGTAASDPTTATGMRSATTGPATSSTTASTTTSIPSTTTSTTRPNRVSVAEVTGTDHGYRGRLFGWGADVTDVYRTDAAELGIRIRNHALATTPWGGRGTYLIRVTSTSSVGEESTWHVTEELQYEEEQAFGIPVQSLFKSGADGYSVMVETFLAGGEQSGWRSALVGVVLSP